MNDTPRALGYRWPAEWEPHAATWLSWPHNRDTWPGVFDLAIEEYIQFAKTIASFEPVKILASGNAADHAHAAMGSDKNVTIYDVATNDAWVRDHGPVFLSHHRCDSAPALIDWGYNAWGEKYSPFDSDNRVPQHVARLSTRKRFSPGFVLEGGAIEGNGSGVALTTGSCVLSESRNVGTTRESFERLLSDYLGIDQLIWLGGNVPGDDTDGHIDQVARFVNEHTVVCSTSKDLPALRDNIKLLEREGKGLTAVELPMPTPKFLGKTRLPASYANFYIVNGAVLVPQFGDANDSAARSILADLFSDREIIGLSAMSLVAGLGAFHCLTQQEND
ncbi:agmatine/peptidylarginine deiminase [Planctomycetota bacterium]